MIGIDPYAPLYNTHNPLAITGTPNWETAAALKEIRERKLVVTGPIVSKPVEAALGDFKSRKEELADGAGLKVTIATGGCLSHKEEIIALTEAFAAAIQEGKGVDKVYIVVGDSVDMKHKIEHLLNLDPSLADKIEIIFNKNREKLIRAADIAMGDSDVVIAKTGELVYTVGGGKAFEAFHSAPSIGQQEVEFRKYVEEKTTEGNLCALEVAEAKAADEVDKLLKQLENGILLQRMTLGTRVPANGARYTAVLIKNQLGQIKKNANSPSPQT